jgi:hypothetical protein
MVIMNAFDVCIRLEYHVMRKLDNIKKIKKELKFLDARVRCFEDGISEKWCMIKIRW